MASVVAVDVGGTTIKSATAEVPQSLAETRISEVHRTPTPIGSASALIDSVVGIVGSYGRDVSAVGLVMPGVLDVPHGRVRAAGNMQLFDAEIAGPVQAALGIPVSFEHDVRAGALAELHTGAARGLRDAAFMPIGTGIAAAFIIDGEVRSADGYMGEIGHAYVGPDEPCVCGLVGCLEAVSSAAAIARRYAALTGIECDSAAVIARATAGDEAAIAVWSSAISGLVRACAMMSNILGPEAIIIGGGLALTGERLFAPLREGLEKALSYQRVPQLLAAEHGDDAGCLGAAILALRDGGLS